MSPSIWNKPLPTSSNAKSTVPWAKGKETLKGEGEQPNKFSENCILFLLTVLRNVPSKMAGVKGSQVCYGRCGKLLGEQVVHIMEGILVLIVVEKQWGTWSFLTTQQKLVFCQRSLAWRDVTCRRQSFWDGPGDTGGRQHKEAQAFTFSSEITPSTLKQFWCFTHFPHELRQH